jgi:hypothetical protein
MRGCSPSAASTVLSSVRFAVVVVNPTPLLSRAYASRFVYNETHTIL